MRIYLSWNIDDQYQDRAPSIQPDDSHSIVIRYGYRPCHAFFDKNGKVILFLPDKEIDTVLTRADFPECDEADLISNYDPDSVVSLESFIVLLSNERVEKLGFQVETDEGWTWDPKMFKSIEVKCSDKTKYVWCPATESWEKPCQCEKCKQESQEAPKYVDFEVIKSIYDKLPYSLREHLNIGNPLADFAKKCPYDNVNYCHKCGGAFVCEQYCKLACDDDY
jgi:hypothetical protein